jgi:diguanylate cyclase (GGDEF)-like protein/PAS domain S-box-containing protein
MVAHPRIEALRTDSLSAYRLIVDNYPDGSLVVFDTDLRYVVAGGLGITGYGMSKVKLEGRTIWEVLPPENCAVVEPHYRAALAGRSTAFDITLNGQILEIKVTPIRDGDRVIAGLICTRNATVERETSAVLAEVQERFTIAFDHAPIGMGILGLDDRWLNVNPAFCAITGYTRSELLQQTIKTLTHPDDLAETEAAIGRLMTNGHSYQIEKRYLHALGHVVWVSATGSLVRSQDGEPLYLVSQVQDISERKHREAELQWQAERDSLTGLWNRHRFDQELARCRNLAERHGVTSAVILLDLDKLKAINDTFGHGGGDEALRRVAEVLGAGIRVTDVAARYGGDEFAVVLPHTSQEIGAQLAKRLVAAVAAEPIAIDGRRVWISVSAGVADNTGGKNPVSAADGDLYETKRARASRPDPELAPPVPFGVVHGHHLGGPRPARATT